MTILIIGYYGFANAGDEAILASIVQQIRALRPSVRLIVASGEPSVTAALHGVEAILWNRLTAIEHAVEATDLVVIGGGGLFHDYWGADPDTLLTDRHWGIAYYAGCAFLAALHRKRLALFAVGVGPLVSGHGIGLTRAICEAASLISVRDSASRDLLIGIGVPPLSIHVTADPAFAFRPPARANPPISIRQPVLGVSVRNWSIGVDPGFLERELAAALDLYLDATQGSVLFFPFQQIEGAQEDDRAIAQRVLAKMRFAEHASIAQAATFDRIYDALRGCRVILGMRLHALIFAATLGIPAVALSYDPKIDALANSLHLDVKGLDVKAIDARILSRLLIEALEVPTPLPLPDEAQRKALQTWPLALELIARPMEPVSISPPSFSPASFDLLRRAISSQLQAADAARQAADAAREAAAEFEVRIAAFDRENASLRTTLRDREADLSGRLHEAVRLRDVTVAEIDRFRANFETEMNAQRSQKAWQLMLLMRKAYTLFARGSKLAFLGWAARAATGRWGSLQEFEPRFPDIASYIPDTFRASSVESVAPDSAAHPFQRDKYDVLIVAIIDFDFRFQRPQQIAAEMARRGHRVFWVSPSRFAPLTAADPFVITPLRENLWEVHMRTAPADIYMGELQPDRLAAMSASLQALAVEWGIGENAVLAQLPFWRRLALDLGRSLGSKILYDCMDDWDTFQNMGAFNISEEKAFVTECDVLIVTGAELLEKYRDRQPAPVLIRNGADFDFFASAPQADLLPAVPHPIVGYFGAIADWIDLDLVLAIARHRPQYSFVLIGQVFDRDTSSLEALPNVFLLGNKRYQDIPAYLRHFDACLIPFLLNAVTKATDPVKLYEYFSLGKPVVATAMAELKQCGDLIYIGRDVDDFTEKLDTAIAERDPDLVARRIAFARTNTWAARVESLDSAVRALFPLVSILIVTYNSEEFVRPCLDSILRNTAYPAYEIVVVDNASTDGTVPILETYEWVRLIRLPENLGFAAGNNRAAADARGEYLVFLNADTMTPPGWLHHLLRPVRTDAKIGQVCPVTNFAGNEAKINVNYRDAQQMEAFAVALARSNGASGAVRDVAVAPLFCSLVHRAVWNQAGELDVSFGMGMFEDDDFSMRIRAAGLRVVIAEDCFVHHFGQGSFAKIPTAAYTALFEKNRQRIEAKWKIAWQPHRTRPGVRPPFEEQRFDPATFVTPLG